MRGRGAVAIACTLIVCWTAALIAAMIWRPDAVPYLVIGPIVLILILAQL